MKLLMHLLIAALCYFHLHAADDSKEEAEVTVLFDSNDATPKQDVSSCSPYSADDHSESHIVDKNDPVRQTSRRRSSKEQGYVWHRYSPYPTDDHQELHIIDRNKMPHERSITLILQQMYDKSSEVQDVSTNAMQNFLASLQAIAHTPEEALMIDGILYGKSTTAATCFNELMNRLSDYVHCHRTKEDMFDIPDSTKKQYLFAAYLGIPIALEHFTQLKQTCNSLILSYIFDAKHVITYRKKQKLVADDEAPPSAPVRYIWRDTGELEPVITDEPLKQTVLKFPESTQQFLQSYFKALQ